MVIEHVEITLVESVKTGLYVPIVTFSGSPIYIHQVVMKIGDREFNARVGFAMRESIPYLLGRIDLLDHFDIRFEGNRVCFVER